MSKSTIVMLVIIVLAVGAIGIKMFSGGMKNTGTSNAKATATLTIDGSNTMLELVTKWSAAYMKAHPDVQIITNGNGSGVGIKSLIEGSIEICSASRSMKSEEIAHAKQKAFTPKEYSVAMDGIAIVVNPANPLKEITFSQLEKIFTGETLDWKGLGIAPTPIEVISRESTSGTYEFFQDHVLKKKDYTPRAKVFQATPSIIQTTAADNGAIGYVGLGYALAAKGKVKVLNVRKDDTVPAVTPSEKAVIDGSYPISRALFFYTRGEATGAVKAFIEFCLSPEGQAIVKDAGFVEVAK